MPHRAGDGGIGQLDTGCRLTQQQPAAAHIAAADEVEWKAQPIAGVLLL